MNVDGSGQTRLTNNSAGDYAPDWSPDGRRIAFYSDRDGNHEIYVMNADGSGETRLTTNSAGDYYPVWSPDGNYIAFASDRNERDTANCNICNIDIYVMNADGSEQTRLTNNRADDNYPAWSPDGKHILFSSSRDEPDPTNCEDCNYEVYVMNADGSGQTRLTNNRADGIHLVWSP